MGLEPPPCCQITSHVLQVLLEIDIGFVFLPIFLIVGTWQTVQDAYLPSVQLNLNNQKTPLLKF